ncbi:hypothetical protein EYF80_030572 [Liparis tanakae]|uniref:Uncharacterized protein n=1 Tax=Liparis tanakae TaxID=230148 RepID=A0A4Z2H0B3_9TELE|nr:hypothetical protein EYF80_030572 [Liparis tanakae]
MCETSGGNRSELQTKQHRLTSHHLQLRNARHAASTSFRPRYGGRTDEDRTRGGKEGKERKRRPSSRVQSWSPDETSAARIGITLAARPAAPRVGTRDIGKRSEYFV